MDLFVDLAMSGGCTNQPVRFVSRTADKLTTWWSSFAAIRGGIDGGRGATPRRMRDYQYYQVAVGITSAHRHQEVGGWFRHAILRFRTVSAPAPNAFFPYTFGFKVLEEVVGDARSRWRWGSPAHTDIRR